MMFQIHLAPRFTRFRFTPSLPSPERNFNRGHSIASPHYLIRYPASLPRINAISHSNQQLNNHTTHRWLRDTTYLSTRPSLPARPIMGHRLTERLGPERTYRCHNAADCSRYSGSRFVQFQRHRSDPAESSRIVLVTSRTLG